MSVLALLLDMLVFSLLLRLAELPWWLAVTAGFIAGAVFLYFASVKWVFGSRSLQARPRAEFISFVGIGLAGLAVTQLVMYIGIELLALYPEVVKLCAAGVTFIFNFILRKALLFKG